MAEELKIASGTKEDKYALLYKQVAEVVKYENDSIALMANIASMIHYTFDFWWTGFYRVIDDELVLAPFQGPMACSRIAYGKGVCGTAWQRGQSIVVDDVEQFPGHIACSSLSRSEIVVPIYNKDNDIIAVLDIDSEHLATFDDIDRLYLEKIATILGSTI